MMSYCYDKFTSSDEAIDCIEHLVLSVLEQLNSAVSLQNEGSEGADNSEDESQALGSRSHIKGRTSKRSIVLELVDRTKPLTKDRCVIPCLHRRRSQRFRSTHTRIIRYPNGVGRSSARSLGA
jgi:hypothetical protein